MGIWVRGAILFLILSFPLSALAQDIAPKDPVSYGLGGCYGAVLRYRTGLPHMNYSNLTGAELYMEKQTMGSREWEREFNLPRVGVGVYYYNYGFPEELGSSASLIAYIGTSIIRKQYFLFSLDLGVGPSYSTRTYDDNELNKAISSNMSFMLVGTLRAEKAMSANWALTGTAAFRHISNGALNLPNNGMNFPVISLGVKYTPKPMAIGSIDKSGNSEMDRRLHFNLMAAGGVKEVLYHDSKHGAYTLSLYANRDIFKILSFTAGMDLLYDSSFPEEYMKASLPIPADLDGRMAAVIAGPEIYMGKLSVLVQVGHYIYRHHIFTPKVYQRYALKYYLTKDLFLNLSLKAHTGKADFIECGIGFKL